MYILNSYFEHQRLGSAGPLKAAVHQKMASDSDSLFWPNLVCWRSRTGNPDFGGRGGS